MLPVARVYSILLCLTICFAGIAVSIAMGKPNNGGAIVAVFPPWWSSSRTFIAASEAGAILNSGAYPFVVIVQSQSPELGARLRAAGALLLLDPLGMGGCLQSPTRDQNV
jgi:hypothetical protein